MRGYGALARTVEAPAIGRVVPADPDDDAVIACAIGAGAVIVATGDRGLLALHPFQDIHILNPADALSLILNRAEPRRPE
jgi:predicted nucleic acid-binding protein